MQFLDPFSPKSVSPRPFLAIELIVIFAVTAAALMFGTAGSADLLAVWSAAREVALGNPDQIYTPNAPVFSMRPPEEWLPALRAAGYQGDVYPYIYPPLWAWLLAPVVQYVPFEIAVLVMRALNGIMLVCSLIVARRLCLPDASKGQHVSFLSIGLAGLLLTHSGLIALYENQPQILVGFLTLLAIERAENGHQTLGGVALAFAAALKAYPALLAIFWLATRQRTAIRSFVFTGVALASLSVFLAGWPLHAEFLATLRTISNTIVLTPLSLTLDTTLGQLLWPGEFSYVPSLALDITANSTGWFILAKPAVLRALDMLILPVTVLVFAIAYRKLEFIPQARRVLWPATMAGLAFVGPLAWSYHFIAPLCAIGLLPIYLPRIGYALAGLIIAGLSSPSLSLGSRPSWPHIPVQLLGSLAVIGLTAALIWIARKAYLGHRM